MSYLVKWHDPEQSILYIVSEGVPTWREFHERYDRAYDAVAAAAHRVDVIMDAPNGMPPGNPLPHLRTINTKWDGVPMLGLLVAITGQRIKHYTETAVDIAGMITGVPTTDFVVFAESVESALAGIHADREAKGGLPTLEARQLISKRT